MAHLSIGLKTPFNKLVELRKKYINDYNNATDMFERAEINGFLLDIDNFCLFRGGAESISRSKIIGYAEQRRNLQRQDRKSYRRAETRVN